jgi:2-methylcitrate dehydratase PrpD
MQKIESIIGVPPTMGFTSRLADFAYDTGYDDLPAEVVGRSREMMLNAAGIALAGVDEHEGRAIIDYVAEMGATPTCTVIGSNVGSTPELAALANGTLVHVLDFDENVERRGNHPSNVMFPVAMAMGEREAAPGADVLAAFAVGCEISTKLGAAGDLDEQFPRSAGFGWHGTPVFGVFGAAAAAGRLLGLDREQLAYALGLATSQSAGIQVNHGTSSKSVQAGSAAMRGIMCARLAQRGFTAARDAIEAEEAGFFTAYRRDHEVDEDAFFARLGAPYDVIDPGVRLKIYPSGSLTHVSIEAMLRLIEQHGVVPDQVRAVRVSVPRRWDGSVYPVTRPATGLEGKFSIAYCMAVCLVHGAPQMHHFTDEAVRDPDVLAVVDRVTVDTDETPTERALRPSTVRITLADGSEISRRAEFALGHKDNPVTDREIHAKFRACSRSLLSPDEATRIIGEFGRFETLPDVGPLFASLAGDRASA